MLKAAVDHRQARQARQVIVVVDIEHADQNFAVETLVRFQQAGDDVIHIHGMEIHQEQILLHGAQVVFVDLVHRLHRAGGNRRFVEELREQRVLKMLAADHVHLL